MAHEGRRLSAMRIAYCSPLPPQRTGIADYSAELLPHVARHAEIDLFVEPGVAPSPEITERFAVHPLSSLGRRLDVGDYDLPLYQLGNNADFHAGIHGTLLQHPGVVVLHEYMLHHLVKATTLDRGDAAGYLEEHRYCCGASGLAVARRAVEAGLPFDLWSYPLFERVVDRSLGVIVHSDFSRRRVLESRPAARVAVVQHHLDLSGLPAISREDARRRLGLPRNALVVGSYGFITPAKRLEVALAAFARLRRHFPEALYLLAGDVSPYYDLDRLLEGALGEGVQITGRLALPDLLAAMSAADIAVNLRHPTGGETSGTFIRLLGMGKPVIASDTGSFAEIPDGCVARVPLDERETDTLSAYLEALAADPELAREMGDNARRHMAENHTLEGSALGYARFLEEIAAKADPPRPAVPPLAPYPPEDLFSDLVASGSSAACDLGVGEGEPELLDAVAEALVDLDLDQRGGG